MYLFGKNTYLPPRYIGDIYYLQMKTNFFGLFMTQSFTNSNSKRTFHLVLTIHVETNFFADGRWNAVAGQTEVDT